MPFFLACRQSVSLVPLRTGGLLLFRLARADCWSLELQKAMTYVEEPVRSSAAKAVFPNLLQAAAS